MSYLYFHKARHNPDFYTILQIRIIICSGEYGFPLLIRKNSLYETTIYNLKPLATAGKGN